MKESGKLKKTTYKGWKDGIFEGENNMFLYLKYYIFLGFDPDT